MITEKYPKYERYGIVSDIKKIVYEGLNNLILACKEYNKTKRLEYLNLLDTNLKVLKALVRISYKRKYINSTNYGAWSRKITNVCNLNGGFIKSCLKQ